MTIIQYIILCFFSINKRPIGPVASSKGLRHARVGGQGFDPLPPTFSISPVFPYRLPTSIPREHIIRLKFITIRSSSARSNALGKQPHDGPPSLFHTRSHVCIGLTWSWALTNSTCNPPNWVLTPLRPVFLTSLFFLFNLYFICLFFFF